MSEIPQPPTPADQRSTDPCDYCKGTVWHDVPPHCEAVFQGSERDEETCVICMDPLETGRRLIQHEGCRRTIHEPCFQKGLEAQVKRAKAAEAGDSDYEDYEAEDDYGLENIPGTATCCFCRGPIVPLNDVKKTPRGIETTKIASDNESHRLIQILRRGVVISFTVRENRYIYNNHGHQENISQFYRENLDDATQSRYELPEKRKAGATMFQGHSTNLPGVLRIHHCDHKVEFLLLTAQQVYECVSDLYEAGWEPSKAEIQPRLRNVQITDHERPLITIVNAFRVQGLQEARFSSRDLAHWGFGDYRPDQIQLHVKLQRVQGNSGRLLAEIVLVQFPCTHYSPSGVVTMTEKPDFTFEQAKKLVDEYGGFGDNVDVVDVEDWFLAEQQILDVTHHIWLITCSLWDINRRGN